MMRATTATVKMKLLTNDDKKNEKCDEQQFLGKFRQWGNDRTVTNDDTIGEKKCSV